MNKLGLQANKVGAMRNGGRARDFDHLSKSRTDLIIRYVLTINGYQNGKYSVDDLVGEADLVERAGLENASLDELRVAAFIGQRQLRWSSDGDPAAEPPLIRKIQALVAEIRDRVRQGRGDTSN